MSSYVDSIPKAPKTLTEDEQRKLLAVSGHRRGSFRDHCIFAVALGTALREHEICALNVGDVRSEAGGIRRRFPLRVYKRSNRNPEAQEAILPDRLQQKLQRLLEWKRDEGELLDDDAPLFASQRGGRLGTRQLRRLFAEWQKEARFERRFTFHGLRHSALTNLYRATRDIRLVQKIARHASIESTTIYTQPTDEDILRAMRGLAC
jgi:integrase/recombinase XerC